MPWAAARASSATTAPTTTTTTRGCRRPCRRRCRCRRGSRGPDRHQTAKGKCGIKIGTDLMAHDLSPYFRKQGILKYHWLMATLLGRTRTHYRVPRPSLDHWVPQIRSSYQNNIELTKMIASGGFITMLRCLNFFWLSTGEHDQVVIRMDSSFMETVIYTSLVCE